MKRLLGLTILFFAGLLWIVGQSSADRPMHMPLSVQGEQSITQLKKQKTQEKQSSSSDENTLKTTAVWVATAYQIDYPSDYGKRASELKQECRTILDEAQADGINTVYFQVRPSCDALYSSKLFPWSSTLSGTCGQAPDGNWDPLKYWVSAAHKRGMRLEAWVNPYRVCVGANAQEDFASLPDNSPAKLYPDWVREYNGGYYFDPGLPEVRAYITQGVKEIVSRYNVDGIQFDDYFYPGDDFDDDSTFATYGSDFSDRSDWRRDNVNQLIQAVYDTVHSSAKNEDCVFGVSPSGIWKNGFGDDTGSETRGFEHYSQSYADSITWIKNGWIDYLCPQVYWEIGNSEADFEKVTRWWAQQLDGSDVQLIIGLAAYKIGTDENQTWQSDGVQELSRQIEMCEQTEAIDGVAVFSMSSITSQGGLGDMLCEHLAQ